MSENGTTAPATTAAPTQALTVRAKAEAVKTYITKNQDAIREALPRVGLTPEALTRAALSCIYKNPLLMECDKNSLMRAIVEAASLGLSFSLGRAYLVPFRNKVKKKDPVTMRVEETWRMEAQFMPGYQGLVDLVRRSAEVKTVVARAVYEGDEFSCSIGLNDDDFRHVPIAEPDDAKLTHAYCIIRFLDGGYQFEVLTRKQINAVRARSKAKDNGPWVTDYAPMAIKTAVKRTTKLCPASVELARAMELDENVDRGERQQLTDGFGQQDDEDIIDLQADGEPAQPATKTDNVKEVLKRARTTAKSLAVAYEADSPEAAEQATLLESIRAGCAAIYATGPDIDRGIGRASQGQYPDLQSLQNAPLETLRGVLANINSEANREA